MNNKRPSRMAIGAATVLTLVFAGALTGMVNYFGWRHYETWDSTEAGLFTLSTKTVGYLKNLEQPVKIYFFFNPQHPLFQMTDKLLRLYRDKGGEKMQVEVVDPQRDMLRAQELAKKFRFTGDDNVVIVECGERHKFVQASSMAEMDMPNPMTGEQGRIKAFAGEEKITSALIEVCEGVSKKVYFTAGHGEGDLDSTDPMEGFSQVKEKLKRLNIDAAKVNLVQSPAIPEDASALIIAGPKSPFFPDEISILKDYIANRKGKLFIMLAPSAKHGLDGILADYGIKAEDNIVLGAVNVLGVRKLIASPPAGFMVKHPVMDPVMGQSLIFTYTRSLTALKPDDAQKARPVELAKSMDAFWGESNPDSENAEFTEGKDLPGPLTMAMAVDTGKVANGSVDLSGSRLLVTGSSMMFANGPLLQFPLTSDFFMNGVSWLIRSEKLIGIEPKNLKQYSLGLTMTQFWSLAAVVGLLLPASILLAGIAIWIKRKG